MVTVFGSVNLDIAVATSRLPLAGETLMGGEVLMSPGGKGANQAHAAQLFGGAASLFGTVGADAFAEPALACLRAAGAAIDGVASSAQQPTGLAMITVAADGGNTIVVAPGANQASRASQVPDAVLEGSRVLLMQLEVPLEQCMELARRARALGCKVILNASPIPPSGALDLAAIDLLIVNAIELRQLGARIGIDIADPQALATRMAGEHGIEVLVTLGEDGALLADRLGGITRVSACPVEAIDTTGAGDTFAGVFAAAFAEGMTAQDAMQAASMAAAIACTRAGAQVAQPGRRAVVEQLQQFSLGRAAS